VFQNKFVSIARIKKIVNKKKQIINNKKNQITIYKIFRIRAKICILYISGMISDLYISFLL